MKWSTAPASTTNLVCFCADCTAANCTDGSSEDTPALMSSIDMTGAAALLLASCSGDVGSPSVSESTWKLNRSLQETDAMLLKTEINRALKA